MESEVSHGKISVIQGYTFDIIQKGVDTEKFVQHISQLQEITSHNRTTHHVGIYDFTIRLRQWKVQNIQQTIDLIEKDNTNLLYIPLIAELKKFVNEMTVTVWEPEFLPFNYVFLTVVFDDKILESRKSYGWLRMSLLPIIRYWRLGEGQISYRSEIDFPMYYQIYYNSDLVKPTLNKVYTELENKPQNEFNIEKYVASCNVLKKYFMLEGLNRHHNLISLLKIQGDFFILGNIGQLDSDFFNVFSLEPDHYKYTGTNPFFLGAFDSWPFPRLFLLYLLSVTPHIWIDGNQTKLKKMLNSVNELKKKYRKTEKIDNEDSLKSLLTLKHELNYLLSDLKEIKNVMKIFKSYILDNPEINEKSIVVTSDDNKDNPTSIKNKINATYIHTLNEEFAFRAKNIEDYVYEITKNLSFLQERIEPLQQQLTRKNNRKLTQTMLYLSLVTTAFAVIVGLDVINRWLNP